MNQPTLYTIDDLAGILGFSKTKIYSMKKEQEWPYLLFGTQARFTEEHLQRIFEIHTKTPATTTRRPRIGTKAGKR
jgi:hypothetical protein